MDVWAFTGGKCPVIIQHLFEPSKILGETPLSEGRCLLSANGEYFKPGATRPSSEFRSPVQFAFPDTNERRSPGGAGNDPHNSGSKPSSTEKPSRWKYRSLRQVLRRSVHDLTPRSFSWQLGALWRSCRPNVGVGD